MSIVHLRHSAEVTSLPPDEGHENLKTLCVLHCWFIMQRRGGEEGWREWPRDWKREGVGEREREGKVKKRERWDERNR